MNDNKIPHYQSLAEALVALYGNSVAVEKTDKLTGGDINKAYGLTLTNGQHVFMKANEKDKVQFFKSESLALSAISKTSTIGTPKVLCTGTDNGEIVGYSFMLMDFVESSLRNEDYFEKLGHNLASLHKAPAEEFVDGGKFGFLEDNFIGSSNQINSPSENWISFFRDKRLLPQIKKADSHFDQKTRALAQKLLDHLGDFLIEPEKPSLLHGDLWWGNILCNKDGDAILIDPASYVGHREADIAMTELFGRFAPDFYEAYKETFSLQPGYEERRDLYNLYHLLNHLNIFGESYLEAVVSVISEYVA